MREFQAINRPRCGSFGSFGSFLSFQTFKLLYSPSLTSVQSRPSLRGFCCEFLHLYMQLCIQACHSLMSMDGILGLSLGNQGAPP